MENQIVTDIGMGYGMGWGMGWPMLLGTALVVLAIVALVKYIRS